MRKILLAGLGLALLSSVAVAEDEGSDCAWNRRFDTWSYVDDRTIILSYSPSNKFKLTLVSRCHGLRNALAVALKSGGSCVHPGDHIVVNRRGWGPEICVIRSVERYDEDAETKAEDENN